jgi:hypothetical protein
MVKLMLDKNGTQVMRVPSRNVMKWQPSPSRAKLHQASHSSPKISKHTCLMTKEGRKKVKSNTSYSLKYPNRVYKFSKALYGLKQASRA